MFTPKLDHHFRRSQLQLTAVFSLVVAILIVIYTLLLLQGHNQAKNRFEGDLIRDFAPKFDNLQPPPNRPLPSDKDENWRQIVSQNVKTFDQRIKIRLIIFGIIMWLLGTGSGYLLISFLLQPAQKATNEQTKFLANASHELKTPITTIKTELSLLKNAKKSQQVKESLQIIDEENDNLALLVDKLLLQLQHEQQKEEKTVVNPQQLGKNLCTRFRKNYPDRQWHFVYQGNQEKIKLARQTLTEILSLLLDNAGKYSHQQSTITLKCIQNQKQLKWQVCNQGIGIPKSQEQNIWQRFYRVANVGVQAQKGSGLGLAIAQELAHNLGGQLYLESGNPENTIFSLEITSKS
ncbi:HAMP domain-containing histidine kinase [bacterium]|nr:HAMP domain-containing histidine kinase [bacterium]